MKNSLNKFLAPLLGTEKFLGGSTRSLAYTDHIIQFGLNNELRQNAYDSSRIHKEKTKAWHDKHLGHNEFKPG